MLVVIQTIRVTWTKISRGGRGATLRNAVAEAFALPAKVGEIPDSGALSYFLHQLHCPEHAEFRPLPLGPPIPGDLRESLAIERLHIHPLDSAGIVRVTYTPRQPTYVSYARDQTGTYRPGDQEALALRLGEWGRICYNWRHDDSDGQWWYDRWTINVGYFGELRPECFFHDGPRKVFSRLEFLR